MGKLLAIVVLVGLAVFLFKRARKQSEQQQDISSVKSDDKTTNITESSMVIDTPSTKAQTDATVEEIQEPVAESRQPEAKSSQESELNVELDWANDSLIEAVNQLKSADTDEQFTAIQAAISECYKKRRSQQFLIYGYSLAQQFQNLFSQYKQNNPDAEIKGVGFMQLATLSTDNGNFDLAIELCKTAIENGLTDGTVTGFEGRIKRIERAREKLQASD
ncbi:MAG: hypothetical protein ACPGUD_07190 [Parashewanella sp.]